MLHAIHDFLPRHQAGSEIYAFELSRELASRHHHVTIVCCDFDAGRRHGEVTWRDFEGLTVVEIVNNWTCSTFEDTYRPPLIGERLTHVFRAVQPDILHVHNLLNLSFDLPRRAKACGISVAATLHDYTLVCTSGGQRLHRAEEHVCHDIEIDRCVRCYAASPFAAQTTLGAARSWPVVSTAAALAGKVVRRLPLARTVAAAAARHLPRPSATRSDLEGRLAAGRAVFDAVDLFVAPSASLGDKYLALGLDPAKLVVSDYGFSPLPDVPRRPAARPLRIGYVGTLVWHKGVHILLEAAARLPQTGWTLTLYGDLEVFPDYARQLRAAAGNLPIRFAGRFDRADTAAVYANIDVLVVPSLWLENSPLVIHEAFMAGVPVVGAAIGGIRDLVDHGRSGFLYDPRSAAELSTLLTRLIDNPDQVNDLTRRLPPVKTISQDADEWEARYEMLLEGASRPAPLAVEA